MVGSVSNKLINHKLNLLSDIGVDKDLILKRCNMNYISLSKSGGRTSYNKFMSFNNETSGYNQYIHEGMTSINLLYSLFSELFSLCLNEKTATKSIESFIKYRFVMGDSDLCKVKNIGNQLIIDYTYPEKGKVNNNSSPVGHFIIFQNILNQYLDNFKVEISLDNSVPQNRKLINEHLNTKCRYEGDNNQMVITSDCLHEKNDKFNGFLYSLQKDKLDKMRESLLPDESFSSDIKELIEHFYSNSDPAKNTSILEAVCDTLGMSRWTLNKKLSAEKTSFSELSKDIKLEKAGSLLETTDKSISEISELCYFSSQAAFAKFFRQNHNLSPAKYREINRIG